MLKGLALNKAMNYIVVTIKEWNLDVYEKHISKLKGNWSLITDKQDLTLKNIKKINPKYIFFTHWSWMVPKEITNNYDCVCMHMTDLPYGRGGSPLQNLIIKGHKITKITALKMTQELDAGDIYHKVSLDLLGTAHEIFIDSANKTYELIKFIVENNPIPQPQEGEIVNFNRRKPSQSQIPEGLSLEDLHNHIRMLDAPGYPKAFLEMNDYRLEFESSDYADFRLSAKVSFIKREDNV
jgi:methionyl-tRNA formyltransferase